MVQMKINLTYKILILPLTLNSCGDAKQMWIRIKIHVKYLGLELRLDLWDLGLRFRVRV